MSEGLSQVKRVLWIVLGLNASVALLKVLAGYLANSQSIVADGFHSLADTSSNIIGLIGITVAMQSVDKEHPYGHKKFETFAALGIAVLLLIALMNILEGAYKRIINPIVPEISWFSFSVMGLTLLINLGVVKYEGSKGRSLHSEILLFDSYHTKSDIYVSLAVIVSLIAVRFGYFWMDTLVSVVIAGAIAMAVWEIIKHSSAVLCDQAILDEELVSRVALVVPGVQGCHKVRSRGRDDDLKVDLHIQVDPYLAVQEGHFISHQVAAAVVREIVGVSDVMVHIEPVE